MILDQFALAVDGNEPHSIFGVPQPLLRVHHRMLQQPLFFFKESVRFRVVVNLLGRIISGFSWKCG